MTVNNSKAMHSALDAVLHSGEYVAWHLRRMARGRDEYAAFAHASPWMVNILQAAADMIETSAVARGMPELPPHEIL